MTLMSKSKYAKHRGVTPAFITKLLKAGHLKGALVKKQGRKHPLIDSEKADRLLKKNLAPEAKKPDNTDNSQARKTDNIDYSQARTRSEIYRAKQRQLDYELKSGEVIPASQVRDLVFKACRICRDRILNVPPRISATVAAIEDEAEIINLLTDEFNMAFDEMVEALKEL